MMKLLQFLIHGCWHNWRRTGHTVDHYDTSFGGQSFMYRGHTTICEKCGRVGHFKDFNGGEAN